MIWVDMDVVSKVSRRAFQLKAAMQVLSGRKQCTFSENKDQSRAEKMYLFYLSRILIRSYIFWRGYGRLLVIKGAKGSFRSNRMMHLLQKTKSSRKPHFFARFYMPRWHTIYSIHLFWRRGYGRFSLERRHRTCRKGYGRFFNKKKI